jgi:phosphoribosylformylglycinamidine synthase
MTRVAILRYPGTWSERDFQHALSLVPESRATSCGTRTPTSPAYDAAIVPGGFTYGDYVRAGAIAKLSPATHALVRFAEAGKLVLGRATASRSCARLGSCPVRWYATAASSSAATGIHMRVESDTTPWTAGLRGAVLRMPIAHGEGCWVADDQTLSDVEARGQVVFRYTDERGVATAASNPNGSLANIAGVCNEGRNVVGLMPHPERCSEALLGGTDGYRVLANLAPALAGTAPAIYR